MEETIYTFKNAPAQTQDASLREYADALDSARLDFLEAKKYREVRDGGYSATYSVHLPAMAVGPWQATHGGDMTEFTNGQRDVAIFLFDVTGKMAEPWLEAGYECWTVDIQHPTAYDTGGITSDGRLHKVHADLTRPWLCPIDRSRIAFVAAFPPCDHLAVSGARWFKGKGLRRLASSVSMFATAAEFCEWVDAPYLIENPVSNIASHWRKSDYTFHPFDFTGHCANDNYTKKTCLWTGGGFVMPEKFRDVFLGEPDNRIHAAPPRP